MEYGTLTVKIEGVSKSPTPRQEVYAKMQIQIPGREHQRKKHIVNMKVDTGAMGNTLPSRVFQQMMPEKLNRNGLPGEEHVKVAKKTKLIAYNNTEIPCFGYIQLKYKHNKEEWSEFRFYIVDVEGPAACGLPMAEALKLVTVNCAIDIHLPQGKQPKKVETVKGLQEQYPEQFDRIGNLPGQAKLHIKDDAMPFIDAPRKYSIHMKPKLKAELEKMESQGFIKKVTEHSDWCSSLPIPKWKPFLYPSNSLPNCFKGRVI